MSRQTTLTLSDPREISFVAIMLDLGGPQFAAEAAKRAGYAKTDAGADRAAETLLSSPRIARAITGEVRRRFDVAAALAFNTLLEICANPRAPANARISAAQELINRSSIGPVASRSMSISAQTSIEDLLEHLDAQENGTATVDKDSVPAVIDNQEE
jgi:hypothetical protein